MPNYYLNKEKVKTRVGKIRNENLEYIESITGLRCMKCGFKHNSTAPFAWHHINPSLKEHSVGTLVNSPDREKLNKELAKCVFLCHCCHAIEHEILRKEEKE